MCQSAVSFDKLMSVLQHLQTNDIKLQESTHHITADAINAIYATLKRNGLTQLMQMPSMLTAYTPQGKTDAGQ